MHDDDEDDRPRPKRNRRDDDEERDERDADEDDYRPRRRRRDDDDDDDETSGLPTGLIPSTNTSALAIIAGYLGLLSICIIPAPFALLLGIVALMQLRKNRKLTGYSRAIVGIVMGALGLLVAIGLVVAGIVGSM